MRTLINLLAFGAAVASTPFALAEERVLDFEDGALGEWIPAWEEQGATAKLAWSPTKSKAVGSLTFFPRIGTEDQGLLCAMADEPIPVEVRCPQPARRVTVRFWASTGCAARLEAIDASGTVTAVASLPEAPRRSDPGEPVPTFELTVESAESRISAIRFSGPREGEFLAADEIRWVSE